MPDVSAFLVEADGMSNPGEERLAVLAGKAVAKVTASLINIFGPSMVPVGTQESAAVPGRSGGAPWAAHFYFG